MDKWSLLFGLTGVAAFLLAVPLAITANLLTPKVASKWAATSRARTARRLKYLETRLSRLEHRSSKELFAEMFFEGLIAVWSITIALIFGLVTLYALGTIVARDIHKNIPVAVADKVFIYFFGLTVLFMFLFATLHFRKSALLALDIRYFECGGLQSEIQYLRTIVE